MFFGAAFFVTLFYLAIYFQSVKGSSATRAGIQLLPLLVATIVSSAITGGAITLVGQYAPFLIISMALFSTGAGMITTLDLDSGIGKWLGYQVLAGSGIGAGFQGGIITVQTVLPLADVPVASAMVAFFQTLGGAIFISVAQSLFQTGLVAGIQQYAPELDPSVFLRAGATELRATLQAEGHEDLLPQVLRAYMKGLRSAFYLTVACAIMAFILCCGLSWYNIKNPPGRDSDSLDADGKPKKREISMMPV